MPILLTLDSRGVLLAFVIGVLVFLLGGSYGLLFLADLLAFLVLSVIVTRIGVYKKEGLGVYEKSRGWKNVLSNGLVPLAIAFMYYANSSIGLLPGTVLAAAYMASVAGVTADKFASEIGVLDGEPIMLLTLKMVKKGMSGGITALGTVASLVAAALIGASAFLLGGNLTLVGIVSASGFFGGIVDSVLGYYEEKGVGNKYTSNFFCAVAAAISCALIIVWGTGLH